MLFFLILASIFAAMENFTLANTLYVDKNEITINASFKGDVINLYGIKEDSGSTIVILKGQKATYFVQKKEKKFGLWLNGRKRKFENIYRYYSIFSESSLDTINIPYLLKPFEIGLENINASSNSVKDILEAFEYKDALFKKKTLDGLFIENDHKQVTTTENLIYTQFTIPQNIPQGNYIISVYTIFDGEIQSIGNIPIYIKQTGILRFIKETSTQNKPLYFAISVAFSIGMAFLGYITLSGRFSEFVNSTSIRIFKPVKSQIQPSIVPTKPIRPAKKTGEGTGKRGRPKKKIEEINQIDKNDWKNKKYQEQSKRYKHFSICKLF